MKGKDLISGMAEEISESDFGKSKGWTKNWDKKGIMAFCSDALKSNKGKIIKVNTEKFYNMFRLDGGNEVVKYPCYNSVLECRKAFKEIGADNVIVKTQGNVKNDKAGSILMDLRK